MSTYIFQLKKCLGGDTTPKSPPRNYATEENVPKEFESLHKVSFFITETSTPR